MIFRDCTGPTPIYYSCSNIYRVLDLTTKTWQPSYTQTSPDGQTVNINGAKLIVNGHELISLDRSTKVLSSTAWPAVNGTNQTVLFGNSGAIAFNGQVRNWNDSTAEELITAWQMDYFPLAQKVALKKITSNAMPTTLKNFDYTTRDDSRVSYGSSWLPFNNQSFGEVTTAAQPLCQWGSCSSIGRVLANEQNGRSVMAWDEFTGSYEHAEILGYYDANGTVTSQRYLPDEFPHFGAMEASADGKLVTVLLDGIYYRNEKVGLLISGF